MIKSKLHSVSKSILEKLIIASFLLLFLNVSVFNQYINISEDTAVELSEEEEGEEEKEEREEKELEVINYQVFYEASIFAIDVENMFQNRNIILDHHVEIVTPPPEFIS